MKQIYTGSPVKKLRIKDAKVQPYVLSDFSCVLTKGSINRYFGQPGNSDWLNDFMKSFSRYGLGVTGLLDQVSAPIVFEYLQNDGFPAMDEAYDVVTVIEACNFLTFAKTEGFLSVIELKFAKLAQLLLDENEKYPLHYQILEITGFNFLKERAFSKIASSFAGSLHEKALKWIPTLHPDFMEVLMTELNADWKSILSDPIPAATFINTWLFSRLPEDVMDELRQMPPKRSYRSKKGPQKKEHPKLAAYLHAWLSLYQVSDRNHAILDQLLSKIYPVRRNLALIQKPDPAELSPFAKQIRNALASTK